MILGIIFDSKIYHQVVVNIILTNLTDRCFRQENSLRSFYLLKAIFKVKLKTYDIISAVYRELFATRNTVLS